MTPVNENPPGACDCCEGPLGDSSAFDLESGFSVCSRCEEALTKGCAVTVEVAEAALRAKASATTNLVYGQHLRKFLRLLDWARSHD